MFIYAPPNLVDFIWARRDKENTVVKVLDFDDLKNFYGSFWESTQKIRKNPDWYNQAGWLQNSPQAVCEWYNPIVQSKMPMLHDVKCHNPFNTDYFIWLDAGITTTVPEGMLVEDRPFDKINLSRLTNNGFIGLKFIILQNNTYKVGAHPNGIPGWPLFALLIISIDNNLIVFIILFSK